MDNVKYRLIQDSNYINLYRIQAMRRILCSDGIVVNIGDYGGLIESEANLSHEGECWIRDNAKVFGKSIIQNNALITENASVENSKIYDDAIIKDDAIINNSIIAGNAIISRNADVYGAEIKDNARVSDDAVLNGENIGYIKIYENAKIYGRAYLYLYCQISGNTEICGDAIISESTFSKDDFIDTGYYSNNETRPIWNAERFGQVPSGRANWNYSDEYGTAQHTSKVSDEEWWAFLPTLDRDEIRKLQDEADLEEEIKYKLKCEAFADKNNIHSSKTDDIDDIIERSLITDDWEFSDLKSDSDQK